MAAKTAVDIPIIDLSPFLSDSLDKKRTVAQAIYLACHQVGFMYLKNHGVPQAVIAQTFEQSRQFFALPLAEKQAIEWSSETKNRGYVGIERERLDETKPGDLKEAFNVGLEVSSDELDELSNDGQALVVN